MTTVKPVVSPRLSACNASFIGLCQELPCLRISVILRTTKLFWKSQYRYCGTFSMWDISQGKQLQQGPNCASMSWSTWAMADSPLFWKGGERELGPTGSRCLPAEHLTKWAHARRGPWALFSSRWLLVICKPRVAVGSSCCLQALSFPLHQRR